MKDATNAKKGDYFWQLNWYEIVLELKELLLKDIRCSFGARHEDSALRAYEQRLDSKVYDEQRRVCARMPKQGPAAALEMLLARDASSKSSSKESDELVRGSCRSWAFKKGAPCCVFFWGDFFRKSVKAAVPGDGNPRGALVLTRLTE